MSYPNHIMEDLEDNRVQVLIPQTLLGIICMVNLLVLGSYVFKPGISELLFPLAVILVFLLQYLYARTSGQPLKSLYSALGWSIFILVLSLVFGWFYFDFSWDGQWYQQAAVYHLSGKWNPIYQPLNAPEPHSSILHFPKYFWLFGAALTKLSGSIEIGKAYNVLVFACACNVAYSFFSIYVVSKIRVIALTAIVLLNPVVWSELTTYLNDGDLYLYLVNYLLGTLSWLKTRDRGQLIIAGLAAIGLINTKFTGLVFFLFVSLFLLIYILVRYRKLTKSFLAAHVLVAALGIGVFGFNPYVTNLINRGNPLYPILGSKQFPSVFANGSDDNENYETPVNMRGKSLPLRLLYANFGKPGNAPYADETDAVLSWSSFSDFSSWKAYNFHETRVSGFGPYFSVLLVFMVILLPVSSLRRKEFRLPVLLFFICMACCLSLSKHFWWPRFFPMLWLCPVVPLFLIWSTELDKTLEAQSLSAGKVMSYFSLAFAAIAIINGAIVAFLHMRWETNASVTLRKQLTELRQEKKVIKINSGWFKTSVEEKLKNQGIQYSTDPASPGAKVYKLQSVVEGYPNEVTYSY